MQISRNVFFIFVAVAVVAFVAAPVLFAQTDLKIREEFNSLVDRQHHQQLTPSEKARYEELRKIAMPETPREVNPLDNQGGPDDFGYFFMDNVAPDTATYSWIELRGDDNATWLLAGDFTSPDDGMTSNTIPISFSFPFYDGAHNAFRIGTNGDIQFTTNYPYDYFVCIPRTGSGPEIAPLSTDLHLQRGGIPSGDNVVGYRDFGTYMVIEWDSLGFYNTFSCPNGSLKFEVILYNTGRIKMQYNQLVVPDGCYTSYPPTIGIQQNGLAGTYLNYACGQGGIFPADEVAIWWFLPAGIPVAPTNFQGAVNGSDVTLTWIDPTTDTNGDPITIDNMQVWLGPIGSGELLATVNPGVQTFTHVGAGNGFHTYNIRAYHAPFFGTPATLTVLVGDFPWHPTVYEWIDISQNGTLLPLGLDEYSAAIPIGFDFTFFDQTFTQLWVGSHGFVTLNDVGFGFPPYINTQIPNPEDPNNTIYCFWDDNSSSTTGAIYFYQDTGAGRFIVSWDGVGHYGSGEQYWFQLILQDDGSIVMNYQTIPINTSCSIGVEDGTGSNGLQACFDGQGDFLPTDNTAIIFYEQSGVTASVSGHVTLDGGNGNITQVLVEASGPGHPTTNPDASGNYALDSVSTGNRRILASLTGYVTDTLLITLDSTGYAGADLTLRRINPPAPTGFQVLSVNNNTGAVILDWANSVDPLVDYYKVYRRPQNDPNWTFDERRYASADTDTLVTDGIYFYCVTAVDSNVTPPAAESDYSTQDTALFGELPPHSLATLGDFDDHIHLSWLAPGQEPALQLRYDDNSAEAWYTVQNPSGEGDYLAVRFTPPSPAEFDYPLPVQACNLYLNSPAALPNLWICPDNGSGSPDINRAYGNWQGLTAESAPGWLITNLEGQIVLQNADDFWIVWQLPAGTNGPGVGTSTNAPVPGGRSYWSSRESGSGWSPAPGRDWMCRVWVGGESGRGSSIVSVGRPCGDDLTRVPARQITLTPEMAKRLGMAGKPALSKNAGPVRKSDTVASTTGAFQTAMARTLGTSCSQAPGLEYRRSVPGNPLDDIQYYKIYRNSTFLVQVPNSPYDDVVGSANENVNYSYYVAAHYDNNQDSPPSNTATGIANMAPGVPSNVAGEPIGASQMRLTWLDPTVNADGTPCVDLTTLRIYRDGVMIGTANAGAQQFSDTPPQPDQFYTWTVRACDEVPNEGEGASFTGAVISPWQQTDYEWVDITANGTLVPLALDDYSDAINIGFTFTFFEQEFTQLWIGSHGFVTLTDPGNSYPPYMETQIPNPIPPNNTLYCFWDDNSSSTTGGIYYYHDTANNRFIIAWVGVGHFGSGEQYTFEMILGDDGSVTNEYNVIPINTSCAIGVEDGTGSNGIQVCFDGEGWLPQNETAIAIWGGPSGRIEGVVRSFTDNQPIEGIRVETMQVPDFTFTDNTGFYSLRLDPGLYTVLFSGQGYCDTTFTNILVEDHSTTIRNAVLKSPHADFSATSISMATWPGHDVSYGFEISNPDGQCPLDFSISDTSAWLSADPETGTIAPNGTMTVHAVATVQGLMPGGDYQSSLIITHDAATVPTIIPVSLLISLSNDEEPASLPTVYALHPNYPNPFNATTSLRFDLPQASRVKLVVFNVMGQSVVTVADGMFPAGRHSLSFDATDLPSGMYLVKLEAGSYRGLQKMLLLK